MLLLQNHSVGATPVNTWDCSRPLYMGVVTVESMLNCQTHELASATHNETLTRYSLFVTEKAVRSFKGHACRISEQRLRLSTGIFSIDRFYEDIVVDVTSMQCRNLLQSNSCQGNTMLKSGTASAYTAPRLDPPAQFWSTTNAKTWSCVVEPVKLTQECASCPIISPTGPLDAVLYSAGQAAKGSLRYVWEVRDEFLTRDCSSRLITEGLGFLSYIRESDGDVYRSLRDESHQTDFRLDDKKPVENCSEFQLHSVQGLPNMAVRLITLTETD